jgi:hypothetical protein
VRVKIHSEVSGETPGWRVHPNAEVRAKLPPVKPGRVVGLGAICDLGAQRPDDARDQSFSVSEFVAVEDGRRVILHEDRGFTVGLRSTGRSNPGDLREHDHPYSWLADLAQARGLDVSADDLRSLPYEVTFTDKVRRWLAPASIPER